MRRLFFAICSFALVFAPMLLSAATTEAAGWVGLVNTDALNVRVAPSTAASIIDVLHFGDSVTVVAEVTGESVAGTSTWYQISSGGYVYSIFVGQNQGPWQGGGGGPAGRRVDVNLSTQTATAYQGSEPVYSAPVTTGKPGFATPTGTFTIFSRIFNETMISTTPGDEYHLDNVYFTQYFAAGGIALHYNYWQPDSVFGNRPSSHGCVGMRYGDAAFFWNFADYGTPVVVHY